MQATAEDESFWTFNTWAWPTFSTYNIVSHNLISGQLYNLFVTISSQSF
jgi:hypothetical protein